MYVFIQHQVVYRYLAAIQEKTPEELHKQHKPSISIDIDIYKKYEFLE